MVGLDVRHASGAGARYGALDLLAAVGVMQCCGQGLDTQDFVPALGARGIVPHIARNTNNGRRSAMPRAAGRASVGRKIVSFACRKTNYP